jgi:hypothetical protein
MKTGGGDFSQEAYQQLRDAYSKEQDAASSIELAGTEVMGQRLGLETLPVDSPWSDKIENWEYPDGKSEYQDGKQSPDEILEIMRQSAQERIDSKKEEGDPDGVEEMSDEEFEAHIDKVLTEAGIEDEEEDSEEEESEEEDTEDEEEQDDDETDDSDEAVEAVAESEADEDSETEDYDADAVASQIAELRAEIEAMSFVPNEPEEETVADDESE